MNLKPCPFCGNFPLLRERCCAGAYWQEIECLCCRLKMNGPSTVTASKDKAYLAASKKQLISVWNHRVSTARSAK
jgi:hypothetical protein